MSKLRLFQNKMRYIKKERRHWFVGITFTRPGWTTDEPIFAVKLFSWSFRVYRFGGTGYSYGGFEQVRRSWLWETHESAGEFYFWKTILPRVINKDAALKYHLMGKVKP